MHVNPRMEYLATSRHIPLRVTLFGFSLVCNLSFNPSFLVFSCQSVGWAKPSKRANIQCLSGNPHESKIPHPVACGVVQLVTVY